jgi:cytochrome c oxidase subunit II
MKILILLVIVLAIIAIVQLTKVYELTRSMRKTREEEISPADNRMNANLMLVWMFLFFAGVIYLYVKYQHYLPDSASEHGIDVDWLMDLNLWGITIAFFIINFALFYVAYKYSYKKGRKAYFQVHDTRLELLWTLIPGAAMAFIIVFGLITWNKITGPASPDAIKIEVYARQFDWTARYAGDDNQLGASNFNLVDETNSLGLISKDNVAKKIAELDEKIDAIKASIQQNRKDHMLPEISLEEMQDEIYRLERHKQRIFDLHEFAGANGTSEWTTGGDDKIIKSEIHFPKGKEVELIFRSQDVIHSAYMPHFRAQMNTVPGLPTRLKMTPIITTAEMRKKLNNDKFDYVLVCNKICGASHYNMQMKVVVEEEKEYNEWLKAQKTYVTKEEPTPAKADQEAKPDTETKVAAVTPTH